MKKIHKAWSVCLGCAILFFCTSGLVTNAFSIYLPYILKLNNFSNTQISTLLTIRSFASFIAMFLTGFYYRHISLKKGMILSGLFVVMGFFMYGIAQNYMMYSFGAILCGTGYGLGSMVPIAMILNRWFISKLSIATGVCASITGISTLGIPSLITISIEHIGLGKTFIIESIIILMLLTFSYILIHNSPKELHIKPYNKEEKVKIKNIKIINYKPIIQGKVWLLLIPMLLLIGSFTSSAYSHLSVYMTSSNIDISACAIIILLSGLAVTSSKLLYGYLSDRISAYICNYIFGSITTIGLLLSLLTCGNTLTMGGSIVLYSLGLGMGTVGLVVWAKELSTPETFEQNNRYFQVGYAAGGLLFSFLPGMLADRFNGSYQPAFIIFTIATFIVLVIIQILYIQAKKSL